MKSARATMSSVACLGLQNFSTLSHIPYDFRKTNTEHKMCVLIFSTNLSESFMILRRTKPRMVKYVYWSSCKVSLIVSDFNKTWIFATDFRKKNWNIKFHENATSGKRDVPYEETDGRRDRHYEPNSGFRNFANAPNKRWP